MIDFKKTKSTAADDQGSSSPLKMFSLFLNFEQRESGDGRSLTAAATVPLAFCIRYISDNTVIVFLTSLSGCTAVVPADVTSPKHFSAAPVRKCTVGCDHALASGSVCVCCVCMCVCTVPKKNAVSLQILEDDGGTRLLLRVPGRHNQVGPGGPRLPRPPNTQLLLNGTEVIEGLE